MYGETNIYNGRIEQKIKAKRVSKPHETYFYFCLYHVMHIGFYASKSYPEH